MAELPKEEPWVSSVFLFTNQSHEEGGSKGGIDSRIAEVSAKFLKKEIQMKKIIALTSLLILTILSYGSAVAAPPTTSVIVTNGSSQPVPTISTYQAPYTLYDSGFVSTPLDLEVAATDCRFLMACVFNNSPAGAVNQPVTLNLDFVYPPLAAPACTDGTPIAAVTLLTVTANTLSSACSNYPMNVLPQCIRVATDGTATSYSVLLTCQ